MDKPIRYEEKRLSLENIPYIAQRSGKTEVELQLMWLTYKQNDRELPKVRWQVTD